MPLGFNEDNTIEQMTLATPKENGWNYIPAEELARRYCDVMIEPMVKAALIRLNPEIAVEPSSADEVIYKLRAVILSVQSHDLVTQNEVFKRLIFEENSYPFGKDGRMIPIRFFGTMRNEELLLNEYVVTNQWSYPWAEGGKRLEIVLLINGFPVAVGELKTPVRSAITWLDAAMDIFQFFTMFATDKKYRKYKIICSYQQFEGANTIVNRVIAGYPKEGLIWHFQGSDKSLLMVFAAQKLRMTPELKDPTVVIVDDRIDLETQITAAFNASDIPNLTSASTKEELMSFFRGDMRKILITTIFKFGEVSGELNNRDNIIVMVDEARRTQEGDLGEKMRTALPNAFFFGLTGTPINRFDKNTFATFGAKEDRAGYMSRYSFSDSIRDGASGVFYSTGISACILFLNNQKAPAHKNRICMIDGSGIYTPQRAQNIMTEENIQEIHGYYVAYRDVVEKAKIVELPEIRAKYYFLAINNYIEKREQEVVSPAEVRRQYFEAYNEMLAAEEKMKRLLLEGRYVRE